MANGTKSGWINARKKIYKFTTDGVFVEEYSSVSEAGLKNKISAVSITNCCKKRQKTAAGFVWKFEK